MLASAHLTKKFTRRGSSCTKSALFWWRTHRLHHDGVSPKLVRDVAISTHGRCAAKNYVDVAAYLIAALLGCNSSACNAPSKTGLFGRVDAAGGGGGNDQGGSGGAEPNAGGGGGSGGIPLGGSGGAQDPGGGGSGGSDPNETPDASPDALDATTPIEAGPVCSGALLDGLCWYLGVSGDSCNDTCLAHGSFDDRAIPIIGSDNQGGNEDQCAAVLTVLLGEEPNSVNTDNDNEGVGCHLSGNDEDPTWFDEPDFSADASLSDARIACACIE